MIWPSQTLTHYDYSMQGVSNTQTLQIQYDGRQTIWDYKNSTLGRKHWDTTNTVHSARPKTLQIQYPEHLRRSRTTNTVHSAPMVRRVFGPRRESCKPLWEGRNPKNMDPKKYKVSKRDIFLGQQQFGRLIKDASPRRSQMLSTGSSTGAMEANHNGSQNPRRGPKPLRNLTLGVLYL